MNRKKGVILSYILMVFEILSTLLLTPFIIRNLGQAEYGVYKLSASITAYLALLDLGIGNSIVRFTAKYEANGDKSSLNKFVGVAQVFYGVMAIIALVLSVVLITIFPTAFAIGLTESEILLGQELLGITTLNAAVTLLTAVYPNLLIGLGLFGVSKGLSIIQIIIRIVVTYVALLFGYKSVAIVSINLLMTILCRGAMIIYSYGKLKIKLTLKDANRTFIKEIVGYSFLILLQMIATQVNAFADQVLLGIFVSGASGIIAIYAVGVQIVQYFQSIGGAISGVLMPGVVTMVENGASPEKLENEMVRIGRMSLIVLSTIFGGFLLYGQQFIRLWAGVEYSDGFFVAVLLMIAQMLIYTESIGTQILWAKNEHKEQSIIKCIVVFVNIFLTILLIKWDALRGATVGTFISLMLGDIVTMNLVFAKKIGIILSRYYYKLLRGILPAITLATLMNIAFKKIGLQGWGGFLINVCVYSIVVLVLLFWFGLNKSEKTYLQQLLKKK